MRTRLSQLSYSSSLPFVRGSGLGRDRAELCCAVLGDLRLSRARAKPCREGSIAGGAGVGFAEFKGFGVAAFEWIGWLFSQSRWA